MKAQDTIVVIDDVGKRGKAAVVVEASPGMSPQPLEGGGAITLIGRTPGLEIVDTDLGGGVHVPARFGEQGRHVAAATGCLAVEKRLAALGGTGVKTAMGWPGSHQGELVEVQGG